MDQVLGDPGDRIPDQLAGGGEIHPNVGAEALPAEPVSVVEGKTAGVLHEIPHLLRLQIGAEIDPHQIGALQRRNVQQRKLLEQALTGIAVIFQDDPAYLPEPGLPSAIRALGGDVEVLYKYTKVTDDTDKSICKVNPTLIQPVQRNNNLCVVI